MPVVHSVLTAALIVVAAAGLAAADRWAVLICGSRDWTNYRHQADICHAYHMLRDHGMPADHIITFVFNDAVNNSLNPIPGKLFNAPAPGKEVPVDYYAGCVMDYKGTDVTLANVMAVLLGDGQAVKGIGSGRVLKSTASDEVVLNFVDHGAPYLVQFPTGPYWYSWQLHEALATMYSRKMFKNLVFYMESCQSGSMFDNMTSSLPVFATTASAANESSYAAYCPPGGDMIGSIEMWTCLSDLYQASWLSTTVRPNDMQESLHDQFLRVKALVNLSTVEQYGSAAVARMPVGAFLGYASPSPLPLTHTSRPATTAVSPRDVGLHVMTLRARAGLPGAVEALAAEVDSRARALAYFTELARPLCGEGEDPSAYFVARFPLTRPQCYKHAVEAYESMCGRFTDHSLLYAAVLLNLCEAGGQETLTLPAICDPR